MGELLNENQQGFKLLKGTYKGKKTRNRERPAYFLKGIDYPVNALLKKNNKGITQSYNGIYGGKSYDNYWVFLIDRNPETGEYLEDQTKEKNIYPLIQKINQLKGWSIQLDKLSDELQDYTPQGVEGEATQEEVTKIEQNLANFEKRFLNLENSEEIKETIKLISQVERADGGSKLSSRNRMAVKLQNPNATKVAPEGKWRTIWNRTVNKNAKAIFVLTATDAAKPKKEIERDFFRQKGVTGWGQLSAVDKEKLNAIKNASTYSTVSNFTWMPFYDVSDTTQIPGTYDEYSDNQEKAAAAKEKLGGRKNPFDDGVESTDNPQLTANINTSLKKFAEELNIPGVNTGGATSLSATKDLAKQVLSKLLDKTYAEGKGGIFKKLHSSAKTPQAREQQSEVASWGFMEAFGINIALSDINSNLIWGD